MNNYLNSDFFKLHVDIYSFFKILTVLMITFVLVNFIISYKKRISIEAFIKRNLTSILLLGILLIIMIISMLV